jgi:hypothetical protein
MPLGTSFKSLWGNTAFRLDRIEAPAFRHEELSQTDKDTLYSPR